MKGDAKTFIISQLAKVVEDISELKILYKFDVYSREHLIKVLPSYEYRSNSNYHKFEEELLFEFIEKFPFDNLVFLTEGDWIDINHHDLEFVGSHYFNKSIIWKLKDGYNPTFNDNKLFAFTNINEDIVNMSEILGSSIQIEIEMLQPILKINSQNDAFFGHTGLKDLCFFNKRASLHNINENSLPETEFNCDTNCGCNNFALAA